jgi:hypothetical protein
MSPVEVTVMVIAAQQVALGTTSVKIAPTNPVKSRSFSGI